MEERSDIVIAGANVDQVKSLDKRASGPSPPLKHAYYAYQGYYSGKMYDFVSILVRVPIVLVRLPFLPGARIEQGPPP